MSSRLKSLWDDDDFTVQVGVILGSLAFGSSRCF
jgi:hypothetical protein